MARRSRRAGGKRRQARCRRSRDALVRPARRLGRGARPRDVHRDVKSENVFLMIGGQLKLLDFGIARDPCSTRTLAGRVLGTAAYMPPEQALRAQRRGRRAVGPVVGRSGGIHPSFGPVVHAGASSAEMRVQASTARAIPIADVAPHVPSAVARVFDRALEFERRDRWPNARAMREALTCACDGVTGAPPADSTGAAVVDPTRKRTQWTQPHGRRPRR